MGKDNVMKLIPKTSYEIRLEKHEINRVNSHRYNPLSYPGLCEYIEHLLNEAFILGKKENENQK